MAAAAQCPPVVRQIERAHGATDERELRGKALNIPGPFLLKLDSESSISTRADARLLSPSGDAVVL